MEVHPTIQKGVAWNGGLQLGNTLLLDSKTKAAQPIYAGLN